MRSSCIKSYMNNLSTGKIAAVVVTFNRKELLPQCLDGILAQTHVPDTIIIVDNHSSDGTDEMLKTRGYLDRENIEYLKLSSNKGATGGFHEGMHHARAHGAEWFWILDDDIRPEPTCLHTLLTYRDISKCLHPRRVDREGRDVVWEPIFDPAAGIATHLDNRSFKNGKEVAFVNAGCFEGMLIHESIVASIGLPDARFFIINDDTIYGFLASLYTNVVCVKGAVITRLLPLNTKVLGTRTYYYIRNQFLIREHLKRIGLLRGSFYVWFFLAVMHHGIVPVLRYRSFITPWYAFRGILDGVRGRYGKV